MLLLKVASVLVALPQLLPSKWYMYSFPKHSKDLPLKIRSAGVFKSLKIDAFTVKNLQVTKIAAADSPKKVEKPSPATPIKKEDKPEVKKPAKKDGKAAASSSEGSKGKAKAKSSGGASSENGSTSKGMTCPICDQVMQTTKGKQDINRYR